MAGAGGRFAFKMVSMAIALPIGRVVTKATRQAWAAARPQNPPVNPREVDTNWKDALVWAALTGVGTSVAQVLTTKGADTAWRALTGRPSPRPKHPKPAKGRKLRRSKPVAAETA